MDWWDTPLMEFYPHHEMGEDGKTTARMVFPHGDGKAQEVMRGLQADVERAYEELLASEDFDRLEDTGEVPVIREGAKRYEPIFEQLTLRDLPAILDTFVVLEEERSHEEAEERERKAKERRQRERIRAKERRKLKKLGEW